MPCCQMPSTVIQTVYKLSYYTGEKNEEEHFETEVGRLRMRGKAQIETSVLKNLTVLP